MDVVLLSRIQFALTIGFHFIFPPITIGLAWLLVLMEGLGWRKNDQTWMRLSEFFGRLFGLTFVVGVATGIVMEFQFGTNWANYSRFVGDVFGSALAAEGVFAFFLESCFMGLYLFGRNRLSKRMHWFSILMVAVGATLSAFWILVANSWQQTPQGFVISGGRAELTDFALAVFNPSMWPRFFHTMTACLVTGAFFITGISAYQVLRNRQVEQYQKSLKLGVYAGLLFSILSVFPTGHIHATQVAHTQPEKFAAIEGLFTSHDGGAPLLLFAYPTHSPPKLHAKIEVPNLLSWMTFGDPNAPIKGLSDFAPDRVPQGIELWLSFVSFHNMVLMGMWFLVLSAGTGLLLYLGRVYKMRWVLWLWVISTPLPIAACLLGWTAAEVGRQPWVVYGVLRTQDAASPSVSAEEVLFSIILFGFLYLALGALWLFLLHTKIKKGLDNQKPANQGAY